MTRVIAMSAAALLAVACSTTYHGLTPLSPKVEGPPHASWPVVGGLQPTLRWAPAAQSGVTYDLVIHEGVKAESFWRGTERAVGREAYYRESLTAPEHRVEQPLKPDTEYYWSVRTRTGDRVSDWSTYSYRREFILARQWGDNIPYRFRTPPAMEQGS